MPRRRRTTYANTQRNRDLGRANKPYGSVSTRKRRKKRATPRKRATRATPRKRATSAQTRKLRAAAASKKRAAASRKRLRVYKKKQKGISVTEVAEVTATPEVDVEKVLSVAGVSSIAGEVISSPKTTIVEVAKAAKVSVPKTTEILATAGIIPMAAKGQAIETAAGIAAAAARLPAAPAALWDPKKQEEFHGKILKQRVGYTPDWKSLAKSNKYAEERKEIQRLLKFAEPMSETRKAEMAKIAPYGGPPRSKKEQKESKARIARGKAWREASMLGAYDRDKHSIKTIKKMKSRLPVRTRIPLTRVTAAAAPPTTGGLGLGLMAERARDPGGYYDPGTTVRLFPRGDYKRPKKEVKYFKGGALNPRWSKSKIAYFYYY